MAGRLIASVVLLSLSVFACAKQGKEPTRLVEFASSLQNDVMAAGAAEKPIVIFISQGGCEYCELLRERILYPMIRAGELDGGIVLREVSLDADFVLDDFQGQEVGGLAFARRYDVSVTPTLLFLNKDGSKLAAPIVGTGNIDFYEVYLNRAIDESRRCLKNASCN